MNPAPALPRAGVPRRTFGPLAPDDLLASPAPGWDPALAAQRLTPADLAEDALLQLLNSGSTDEVQRLPGFNRVAAERLVEFRRVKGPFASLDELIIAPLIGQSRFELLTGRASLYPSHPLHAALRLPYDVEIRTRDLQPLANPPAPFGRIFLGEESDLSTERTEAAARDLRLTCCRIGAQMLYFHHAPTVGTRPPALFTTLPRALRFALQRRRPCPASP